MIGKERQQTEIGKAKQKLIIIAYKTKQNKTKQNKTKQNKGIGALYKGSENLFCSVEWKVYGYF